MIDTFSKDLLNIDYTKEVWETEGTVRLLGAVLKDTLSRKFKFNESFARAIFEESIITTIGQFHRTENIRISASRVIASMYHIDPKFVIKKLIDEIKEDTSYPGYFRINGAVVVTLAKIPGYWEGTREQYERVKQLNNLPLLGEDSLTAAYKRGWLNGEALKKWKELKQ